MASEAVQKIATDKKKVSQMLLVCYYLLNSQNIPVNNQLRKKVGHLRRKLKKLLKFHRKKEQWLIHGEFYP